MIIFKQTKKDYLISDSEATTIQSMTSIHTLNKRIDDIFTASMRVGETKRYDEGVKMCVVAVKRKMNAKTQKSPLGFAALLAKKSTQNINC